MSLTHGSTPTDSLVFYSRFQRDSRLVFQLVLVCFVQQFDDFLGCRGLPEEVAEVLVTQMFRDVFQTTKVITRSVRRRDEEKQNEDVLAIEARKVDAIFYERDSRHQLAN